LLSWAACFGSRVNRSGSASAVSILAMMPLMRSISASASAIRCLSGVRFSFLPRSGLAFSFAFSPARALPRSREPLRVSPMDDALKLAGQSNLVALATPAEASMKLVPELRAAGFGAKDAEGDPKPQM